MTASFEDLIKENKSRIVNICRSYADVNEQDDLYQAILEQLWRSQKSFRGEAAWTTWLFRISINTAMSYQRKKVQARKVEAAVDYREPQSCQGLSEEQIMQTFAAGLSTVNKSIFVLYVNGLNTSEMSEVIGLTGNAIKVRIARMKADFRQRMID